MKQIVERCLITLSLLIALWFIGAQASQPDGELITGTQQLDHGEDAAPFDCDVEPVDETDYCWRI